MSGPEAEEVIEKLALYDVDMENHPSPSIFDIGTAIRVLGMADAFECYSNALDDIQMIEENEKEE